ncbi:MAG TPA: T9SS type A sorting domain-containing protein [Flavobacteriales bacterium]|nr:T9SS type A sorting domain-containing protein [Flavobacteriales bacterium]
MKLIYATLLCSGFALPSNAQECAGGRYSSPVFTDVTVTAGVVFGSNTAVAGGTQTLRMDVYQPTGDVLTARPVILVAFGGSFVAGSRADVADLCTTFAKMGYVAIAPDYRVGFFFPNVATTMRAVMRGAHDMKACVRYLRKSVAELGNPYNIDPERIISGGVSAGAISAIHAVYLDEDAEVPAAIASEMPALGGIEGNSGSPGYSSDVMACYSFSGAIGDTLWVQPGDQPLVSVHEVGDGVVPYYTQEVSVIGVPTGLIASGSHDIHLRFAHMGIPNCFLSYPGSDHVGYLTYDPVTSVAFVAQFCAELACGQPVTCTVLTTGVAQHLSETGLNVAPNPSNGVINFQLDATSVMSILDVSGREVMNEKFAPGTVRMDISKLPDGVYILRSQGITEQWARVVKAD